MKPSPTYDTDILEWSEQQASALRDLPRRRHDLSNELDWENIAEEIEDVGRSEFVVVQSLVRQILIHVIKALSLGDRSVLHWRKEVIAFHAGIMDRVTPSMLRRIDLDKLWRQAITQVRADLEAEGQALPEGFPVRCPIGADELLGPNFDFLQALDAIRGREGHP
jgi:hypothetical protein